ncbi:MAG: NYN domain-containing protein [Rhizobiaceae bacterium]
MSFSSGNPVAVLIDAETVDAADAKGAIAALSERFAPLILHAFGDFRSSDLQAWCDILDEFDGQALQVTPTAGYRNSVHICLTMNVMELLQTDRASAVCLFCGAGDFSQLAIRVRRAGLPVYGFGTTSGRAAMAPFFDSWHVVTDDGDGGDERYSAEPLPLPGNGLGFDTAEPVMPVTNEPAEKVIARAFEFTDADIETAVQSARSRRGSPEAAEGDGYDAGDNDDDAMAAIEGKSRQPASTVVDNPPPLADMALDGRLTEDATILLSGFISDHLNGNGYALLSDVANAATATDLLVPPHKKADPYDHLKWLLQSDGRFEITRLPMGDAEPEFVRRL